MDGVCVLLCIMLWVREGGWEGSTNLVETNKQSAKIIGETGLKLWRKNLIKQQCSQRVYFISLSSDQSSRDGGTQPAALFTHTRYLDKSRPITNHPAHDDGGFGVPAGPGPPPPPPSVPLPFSSAPAPPPPPAAAAAALAPPRVGPRDSKSWR